MQRIDHHAQKALYNFDQELYGLYMKNPFIHLTQELYDAIPAHFDEFLPDDFKAQEAIELLPFRKFAVFLPFWDKETETQLHDGLTLYLEMDDEQAYPQTDWRAMSFIGFGIYPESKEGTFMVSFQSKPLGNDSMLEFSLNVRRMEDNKKMNSQLIPEHVLEKLKGGIDTAIGMLLWSQLNDKYPVEVRDIPKKVRKSQFGRSNRNRKKPWTRHDYPQIIFLDQLPRHHEHGDGKHHASPVGHMRRGHWRTLKHERYKNHAKYGSRIRVRPAWIGDEHFNYRGREYRVLHKEGEQDAT